MAVIDDEFNATDVTHYEYVRFNSSTYSVVQYIFIIIGLLINTMITVSLAIKQRYKNKTNLLFINLTTANLLGFLCLFGIAIDSSGLLDNYSFSVDLLIHLILLLNLSIAIIPYNLSLIAIVRYRFIVHPLFPKCSYKTIVVYKIMVWMICFLYYFISLIFVYCKVPYMIEYCVRLIIPIIQVFIPLIVTIFLYFKLIVAIRNRNNCFEAISKPISGSQKLREQSIETSTPIFIPQNRFTYSESSNDSTNLGCYKQNNLNRLRGRTKENKKVITTCIIAVMLFILTYLPYVITHYIIEIFNDQFYSVSINNITEFLRLLVSIGGSLQALIYAIRLKDIREDFKVIGRKLFKFH